MELQLVGPHPFARDLKGRKLTQIGTIFPTYRTLYTESPGVHAWQRLNFIARLNLQRRSQGLPPFTEEEEEQVTAESVDLAFDLDQILIRPDPGNIELAFAADELLHTLASKRQVKFLSVGDARVRDAIKRRGECWRLSSLPKTLEGMRKLILGSKVAIHGGAIYYYNRLTGTRWLTYQEFEGLGRLDDRNLASHLREISDQSAHLNRLGRPEIDFFAVDLHRFGAPDFAGCAFEQLPSDQLRARFEALRTQFRFAVLEAYLQNDSSKKGWCERMLSTLFLDGNESQTEQILSGLSPEFHMAVDWLPGGRFEDGEFLLDSIFEEAATHAMDSDWQRLCDPRAKEIILNFIRDYGDLEFINLGCVPESLSLDRPQREGRRAVYLAEFQVRHEPVPLRRFLRLQKWGVWEHLDEGKDLLHSILESDEYTDYSLDRRLGCRQLGMNLCRRVVVRRLNEIYRGSNSNHLGEIIRTPYFEREYLSGVATDKLPLERYGRPGYAAKLANLLGRAAASSLIVGRSLEEGKAAFDDGDEMILEADGQFPSEILVADHSGAFSEYELSLESFGADYAEPINVREKIVPEPRAFAQIYLEAMREQLLHVQGDYRKRLRAFNHLFQHCRNDPGGSFAYRWECVLRRLDKTDVEKVVEAIRQNIRVLNPANPIMWAGSPGRSSQEPANR